ncbi:MAG: NusA-like transcription termination signal-binding factor [Candidatus Diapherotrites archaeon]|nr:NusA-like transcription termination signal-binding factor [Candidatus Diapherotrites archaeon]
MKLSMDEILLMNALQQVTGVMPKDCLIEGQMVVYLVAEKEMGRAIGKAAINVKTLQEKLKKRVELVPYYEKPEDVFAKALEVDYATARQTNGKIIVLLDGTNKAKAYKNNSRIKRVKELIKRNFDLDLVIN